MVYTKNEQNITERNAMCRSATNCSGRWRSTTRVSTDPPIDERANQYGAGPESKEVIKKIKEFIDKYKDDIIAINGSVDTVSKNLDKLIETYTQNRNMYSDLIERLTREKADSDKKVETLSDKNAKFTSTFTKMRKALSKMYGQQVIQDSVKSMEDILKDVPNVVLEKEEGGKDNEPEQEKDERRKDNEPEQVD